MRNNSGTSAMWFFQIYITIAGLRLSSRTDFLSLPGSRTAALSSVADFMLGDTIFHQWGGFLFVCLGFLCGPLYLINYLFFFYFLVSVPYFLPPQTRITKGAETLLVVKKSHFRELSSSPFLLLNCGTGRKYLLGPVTVKIDVVKFCFPLFRLSILKNYLFLCGFFSFLFLIVKIPLKYKLKPLSNF